MPESLDPFVITVDGALDAATARAVVARLRELGSQPVVIDFVRGTERDVVPLSMIADAIAARGAPVTFRGVCQHDVRILRYLGVALAEDSTGELSR